MNGHCLPLHHAGHRTLPGLLLACLFGLLPAAASAGDSAGDRLRADCRLEGEAGGLSGKALDAFIEQCVTDLLEVELHNVRKE